MNFLHVFLRINYRVDVSKLLGIENGMLLAVAEAKKNFKRGVAKYNNIKK